MYGGVGGNNTNGRGSAWKLLFVGDLELSRENPGSREGAGCKAGNNGALVESFTCFFSMHRKAYSQNALLPSAYTTGRANRISLINKLRIILTKYVPEWLDRIF